jgi:DNA-binding transcriptional LysR family regulator
MDLAQLEAFVAICRCGSFRAAARALHLTQPAVTARIKALELAAGQRLLERQRGRVGPTAAGRALLPHAQAALDAVAEGRRAVAGGAAAGTVRLAVSVIAGAYLLPHLLQPLWSRYPGVEVDVRVCPAAEVAARVLDGEAQIGLTRPAPDAGGLVVHRLPDDPICLVVPPGHPFAARHHVTSAEVAAERRLIVSSDKRYWDDLRAQFARIGVTLHPALDAGLVEVSKQLVCAGVGVAFLPRLIVQAELEAGHLVAVPVEGVDLPVVTAAAIRAAARELTAPAAAFWEIVAGGAGLPRILQPGSYSVDRQRDQALDGRALSRIVREASQPLQQAHLGQAQRIDVGITQADRPAEYR